MNWWNISQDGIIDYVMLMSVLHEYKAPHRKITTLLKNADLIRIKKGLYLVGDKHRRSSISKEFIANLLYGPSYVSQEYALQYHGLIPEQVKTVTSMTTKRYKHYETPLGAFQYTYINPQRYTVGVDTISIHNNLNILMASPEKAIADTIIQYKEINSVYEMQTHLIENLRINSEDLKNLDKARLSKIRQAYKLKCIDVLCNTIIRM